jgi:hypothetical protein
MEEVSSWFVLIPRACGMHGTGEKSVQSFGVEAQRKINHSENKGIEWDQNDS